MKKIKLLLLLIMPLFLLAQQYPVTSINISLPQNPDPNTSRWATSTSILNITAMVKMLNGKIDPSVEGSKILVNIKKSGSIICGSYTINSAPQANFTAANKVWTGNAAVSLLGQECTLSPGEYEICVRFYGGPRNAGLSEEKCKSFSIRAPESISYQPPQLIMPANNSRINTGNIIPPVSFKWTPIIPRPQEPTTYRLKVWQLMQGQTPTQAVNANNTIVETTVENLTQTTIRNLLTEPCLTNNCGKFVWNVQSLNKAGKPIGENNGTSESFTFFMDKNQEQHVLSLLAPANNSTIENSAQPKFQWKSKSGDPIVIPVIAWYKITIVEIIGDQSTESAFRTNKPHFERDSIEALKGNKPIFERDSSLLIVYDYGTIAPKLQQGKKYAWKVQAKGKDGKVVEESEVWVFKMRTAGCGSVTYDTTVTCKGWNEKTGLPIYEITISLKNEPTSQSLGCNVNYSAILIHSGGGTISNPSTLPITIQPNATKTISFTYSPPNLTTTSIQFQMNGNWQDGDNNTMNFKPKVDLPNCICRDCDNTDLNAKNVQAVQVTGNQNQYNISGNFSISGLPENIQAIEVQVQSFSYENSPDACSNGIQSILNSGVLLSPLTTINNTIPVFQNVAVLNDANASKNVKLIIGGNGLPQPASIPFNLSVGVPGPLVGLEANCCKIQYQVCFKVIVYYGKSPGNCRFCEFIFCKSFSNQ